MAAMRSCCFQHFLATRNRLGTPNGPVSIQKQQVVATKYLATATHLQVLDIPVGAVPMPLHAFGLFPEGVPDRQQLSGTPRRRPLTPPVLGSSAIPAILRLHT